MNWIFWVIAIFIFLIGEIFSTSFYLLWFAIGATIALISTLFDVHTLVQIAVFAIVSGALVANSNKILEKYICFDDSEREK